MNLSQKSIARKQDVSMAAGEQCPIDVGNHVRLLSVPAWLLKDLPSDEQLEMLSYIGRIACVQSIDAHGYIWLGFGSAVQFEDYGEYVGHSFCVLPESVELHFLNSES
ncbi:hypothetical protein [Delftia sp. ASV31]|uniref:hypothetical protein n=1 Tax=Delftia sp. ASV31 TaxID=2795113 RepID=UPI0018EBC656|nr:hypothetical protein [Delftia sp. ASV31]